MLPGKKLTPADGIAMARRHLGLLLVPPLVTLFAALLYSSRLPDMYESDMIIAIVPQRVPDEFVRSTVTLRTEQRLDALTIEVLSRSNLEQLILEFGLYPEERAALPMEDVVDKMRGDLVVGLEPVRRGPRGPEPPHAFHVRFTYFDGPTAAQVTQKVGTLFVEQNARDRGALAVATNQFLESQLADARKRLEEQERRLEAFRERHGQELPTQLQTNMQAIQSKQLQVQALVESLARDRDRKQMLERLYREAAAEPPALAATATSPPGVSGTAVPANATARQQLAAARANLASLELRYKPEHPDVVRARRLVAELEPRADAEARLEASRSTDQAPIAPVSPADAARRESLRQMLAEIESLDRQTTFKESEENRLRAEIAEYQRRIEAVPGLESEWVALTRDYQTNQAAYTDLLAKSEAAKVSVNLEERQIGEQFRIVDPAGIPVHPVTSVRAQINAGGLALGLLLGFGFAAFLEFRDASFRSDTDVLEVLGLPVLATVPHIVTSVERLSQRRRRIVVSLASALCVAGAGYLTWSLKLWKSLL